MAKAIFSVILNLIATIIQIICWPLNQLISMFLPDFSSKLIEINSTIGTVFNYMTWALSILPTPLLATLTFIVGCEIAKNTIYVSTHALLKVWNIIQKIKFW